MIKRLLTAILAVMSYGVSEAQCPGCVIDVTCTGTQPTLCPAVLPDATQGDPYDQDLSFFLPRTFTDAGSGTSVELQVIKVVGLSGMPSGLSWETSSPTNEFHVTADPATQRGCAKICGTPTLPGNYTVVVSVLATVKTIVDTRTVPQQFTLDLLVHPQVGGNPYFSFNPSSACGTAAVTYEALVSVPAPNETEYVWDFGNGNTSSSQYPAVQNYTSGTHYPSLTTNIYEYVFDTLYTSFNGSWWAGDVEELVAALSNPDPYFVLLHGSGMYTSSVKDNVKTARWDTLGIVLDGLSVDLTLWDKDNGPPLGSQDDDGGTYTFTIPGAGRFNYTTTAVASGGGGTSGWFSVKRRIRDSYQVEDTLVVYDLPPVPQITSSTGGFTECSENLPVLSVPTGGYTYQWYENDTTLIGGADSSAYEVPYPSMFPFTANYKVRIMDTLTGCGVTTPNVLVTINEAIVTSFSTSGVYYAGGRLQTVYNYANYQWLLDGVPLYPDGTEQTYQPSVNGTYSLVVTTSAGCTDTSNIIVVGNVSINEFKHDAKLSVFPNPSNGTFTISLNGFSSENASMTLMDLSGKIVHKEMLVNLSGAYNKTFTIDGLSSGLYTITVSSSNNMARAKLVVR